MYIPEIYQNHNKAEIESFLKANSFGIIINSTNGKFWGTHIPMELYERSGQLFLEGHISLENPQVESLQNDSEVLCIFNGPHSYISSSWYDHENVPTWNYIAVHVYGKIRVLNHEQTVKTLERLVDKYELSSKNPVSISDLSAKTMRQARGVLGFEIIISDLHACKKMSQNRDQKNYDNIIDELDKTNNHQNIEVANQMKKCPR